VEAILNMQGYNDVTGSSLADALVGGSAACLSAVEDAFAELGKKLTTAAGRRQLESDLNVCGAASSPPILEHPPSRALFAEAVADPLIPQSNDPACTYPVCDIRRQCLLLTNVTVGSPYSRLVEVNRLGSHFTRFTRFSHFTGTKVQTLTQKALRQLANPSA
jgi:hypothetical protein